LKAETTEPSVEEGSRKGDILATSLSSKFFENLKRSGSSKDSVSRRSSLSGGPKEMERERDVHEAMEGEVEEDEEESVAALKARLRSIGVLGESAVPGDKLSPLSPSIQRKIDSRAAVTSDDGVYRARRARHKKLYLEQEEQLRIKAAHCKEVVRCVSSSSSLHLFTGLMKRFFIYLCIILTLLNMYAYCYIYMYDMQGAQQSPGSCSRVL
jgi:hypothetical protein